MAVFHGVLSCTPLDWSKEGKKYVMMTSYGCILEKGALAVQQQRHRSLGRAPFIVSEEKSSSSKHSA